MTTLTKTKAKIPSSEIKFLKLSNSRIKYNTKPNPARPIKHLLIRKNSHQYFELN